MAQSIAANATIASLGRVVNLAIGIGITALVARILGVQGYGQYTLLISLGTMLQIVADAGLYLTLTRRLGENSEGISHLFATVSTLRLVLLGGVYGIAAAILVLFFFADQLLIPFLVLVVGFGAQSVSQLFMGVFQAKAQVWKATIGDTVGRFVQLAVVLLIPILVARYTLPPLLVVAVAFSVSTVTAFGIHRYFLPHLPLVHRRPTQWKHLIQESWPLAALLILNVIYFRVDAVMLAALTSNEEVGWYGLAYRIMESLLFFPAMLGGVLLPRLTSYLGRQANKARLLTEQALVATMSVAAGLVVLLMMYPEVFVQLLGGSEFLPAVPLIRVLSLALAVMFVGNIIGFGLIATQQQRRLLKLYSWLVVGNIAGNLLLIPYLGALAAALTTLATEAAAATLAFRMLHQQIPISIPLPALNRIGLAALAALGTGAFISSWMPGILALVVTAASYCLGLYLVGGLQPKQFPLLLAKPHP